MNKLSAARARMLLSQPFFATLLLGTPSRETRDIPTAATNGRELLWNPDFMATLTLPETMGVMAHEVMHMALEHCLRVNGRNPVLWNVACDYAINLIITDSGMTLPKGGLLDRKYANMSADVIYDLLLKEVQKQKGKGKGSGQSIEDMFGKDSMHGDVMSVADMTPTERAKAERQIRQQVAQAANMARMAGKLTGSLEALVGQLLNPTVPWQTLLRDYMTRVSKDDESWQRRNRRFSDVYLPARWSQTMGEIIIIGDTSGSVTEEELNRVAAEINAIAEQMKPELIRVIWADTEVKREETFEPGSAIALHPLGRGGTDMRVPLTHAEQYDAQVVVLITDGYTPWPAIEPPYPLIVCCTTQVDVPVGLVVRV